MHAQLRYALLVALLAFISTPTQAQESRWYVGVGAGISTAKDACDGVSGPGVSCDDEDTATKFFGGYQINPNFAVEVGYTDLGKASATFTGLGTASFEASGFEAVAVGILPLNPKWSLYGKAGLFMWDLDLKDGTGIVGNFSESGTDLTFGFGAGFDFSKTFAVRVEYQLYKDIGDDNTTGTSDVDVIGANLLFRF